MAMTAANSRRMALLTVAAPLVTAACASDGPSRELEQMIAHASTAIQVSATSDAKRHAAAELALAEEKLAAARRAGNAGEEKEANRLLAEALVNLELARAKAESERVRSELQRMEAAVGNAGEGVNTDQRPR